MVKRNARNAPRSSGAPKQPTGTNHFQFRPHQLFPATGAGNDGGGGGSGGGSEEGFMKAFYSTRC